MKKPCLTTSLVVAVLPLFSACMSADEASANVAKGLVLHEEDAPKAHYAAICWAASVDQQQRARGDADLLKIAEQSKDHWGGVIARLSPGDAGPMLVRYVGLAYEERINAVPNAQRAAKANEIFEDCRTSQQNAVEQG